MFSLRTKLTSTKIDATKTSTAIDNSSSADSQYSAAAQSQLAKFWAFIAAHPKSIAAIILLILMTLFLTLNVNGYWDFALPLRGKKLLALMVVGYAIGVSTLLFQTLTHNPILTPSLLGFDSLYVLLQSLLVFFLGAISFTSLRSDRQIHIRDCPNVWGIFITI